MLKDRAIAWVVGLALLAGGGGCHTSSTWAPLTISVRDKYTRAPVADARVEARTLHFFIEWDAIGDPIFDPNPPESVRGVTGPDGAVRLVVIAEHPVQIIAVAAGYDPQVVDLDRHPVLWSQKERLARQDQWLDADPGPLDPATPPRLEVHIGG